MRPASTSIPAAARRLDGRGTVSADAGAAAARTWRAGRRRASSCAGRRSRSGHLRLRARGRSSAPFSCKATSLPALRSASRSGPRDEDHGFRGCIGQVDRRDTPPRDGDDIDERESSGDPDRDRSQFARHGLGLSSRLSEPDSRRRDRGTNCLRQPIVSLRSGQTLERSPMHKWPDSRAQVKRSLQGGDLTSVQAVPDPAPSGFALAGASAS